MVSTCWQPEAHRPPISKSEAWEEPPVDPERVGEAWVQKWPGLQSKLGVERSRVLGKEWSEEEVEDDQYNTFVSGLEVHLLLEQIGKVKSFLINTMNIANSQASPKSSRQ